MKAVATFIAINIIFIAWLVLHRMLFSFEPPFLVQVGVLVLAYDYVVSIVWEVDAVADAARDDIEKE